MEIRVSAWKYRPSWWGVVFLGVVEVLLAVVGLTLWAIVDYHIQDTASDDLRVLVALPWVIIIFVVAICPPWTFHLWARLYTEDRELKSIKDFLGVYFRLTFRAFKLMPVMLLGMIVWAFFVVVIPFSFFLEVIRPFFID